MPIKVIKYNNVDKNLLDLLNSEWDNKELKMFIERLMKAGVLTADEKKVCNQVLEQIELTSEVHVYNALTQLKFNCYWDHSRYEKDELLHTADLYLELRINDKLKLQAKRGMINAGQHIISKTDTAVFLNRYADVINVRKETTLDDFLNSMNKDAGVDESNIISTACESVNDYLNGGIKAGQITTIMGDLDNTKSLWSLNIAYQAIKQNKNVLYITLGVNESVLNERLMLLHSYDLKFEEHLVKNDADGSYDKDIVQIVCEDFYNNFSNNLIVLDESYFDISTVYSLQKLFVFAENKFKTTTQHGIDLVVIDDLTYMKLDSGTRLITNKKVILDEYYSFFSKQCKNFLGTQRMIPILVTYQIPKRADFAFIQNDQFDMTWVPEIIESLSNNIFVVRSATPDLKVMVIQSPVGNSMEYYESTSVWADNWYMGYNIDDSTIKTRRSNEIRKDASNADVDVYLGIERSLGKEAVKVENSLIETEIDPDDPFGDPTDVFKGLPAEEVRKEMLGDS